MHCLAACRLPNLVLALTTLSIVLAMVWLYEGRIANLDSIGTFQHPLRSDFALYYRDSVVAVHGGGRNLYDFATFRQVTASLGISRIVPDPEVPSLSLPPLIWLVIPFTTLPFGIAYVVWLVLLGSCLVLTWAVSASGRSVNKLAQLLVAGVFAPVSFAIADGQAILLVMAVVAGSWWLLKHEHDIWAGIVLALLVFKPQIAFLVPLALLLAGRKKAFISYLGAIAVLASIVVIAVPWESLVQYLTRLAGASRRPGLWSVNTSLTVASQGRPILTILSDALVLATASVAVSRHGRPAARDEYAIVAGLLGSLLVTPYLHFPDLAILVLAAWLFLHTEPPRWQRWLLFAGYWTATFEPFGGWFTRPVEMIWLGCLMLPASASLTWPRKTTLLSRLRVPLRRAA